MTFSEYQYLTDTKLLCTFSYVTIGLKSFEFELCAQFNQKVHSWIKLADSCCLDGTKYANWNYELAGVSFVKTTDYLQVWKKQKKPNNVARMCAWVTVLVLSTEN